MAAPNPQFQSPTIEAAPPQYGASGMSNEKQEYQQTAQQIQPQFVQAQPQPQVQYDQQGNVVHTYYQQVPGQQQQYVQAPMQQQPGQPQVQYVQMPAQQVPQQAQGTPAPTSTFAYAVPLATLQEGPAPVDCPLCRVRQITRTEYIVGSRTHLWAGICCILFGLPCIPYLMESFKDVQHKCGNCGGLLATWQRNSSTIVHAYPMATNR